MQVVRALATEPIGIAYPEELVGLAENSLTPHFRSVGLQAFLNRAIRHASEVFVQQMAQQPKQESLGLEALVGVVKKESKKVHVDLPTKLREVSFEGLHAMCLPDAEASDMLATKAAALLEKGVAQPFVEMDIGIFLPPWAANKVRLFVKILRPRTACLYFRLRRRMPTVVLKTRASQSWPWRSEGSGRSPSPS